MEQFELLLDLLGRLAAAAALALPLGWHRERSARAPGLRTYLLVAIAACGFLTAGRQALAADVEEQSNVLAALLGGIGVLGGAVVFLDRGRVRGMADAVAIWVTAAIGAAVAYGLIGLAAAICLLTFGALRLHHSPPAPGPETG